MIELRDRFLKLVLLISLLGALCLLWAQPINFTAVDIGRHIKNGQLLLQGQTDLLYKNYYSFTCPGYAFINHHWFFGVVSYFLWKVIGFNGLSITYVAMLLAAFLLFFQSARRYASFPVVFFLSAISVTVLCDRREIRPEGFSTLAMGIYFYLLTQFKCRALSLKPLLLILVPLQLIWINTHIFFFMGPVLVLIFLWDECLLAQDKIRQKALRQLLCLVTAINVINPSELWGMLTPFNIFREFGYPLAENQNIFFMMQRFTGEVAYRWYLVILVVAVIGGIWAVRRQGLRKYLPFVVLAVFMAAAGVKAVRLMPFFAFFFIPLAAMFYGRFVEHRGIKAVLIMLAVVAVVVQFKGAPQRAGVGLMPQINKSAEFFKAVDLKGPIFSNYDIGGYLIFHLAPQERLFVDNRQEAFPPDFFKKVYMPMQETPSIWQEQLAKHDFQVVYFYRHDLTPWGQQFMVERISDPAWAPVLVDNYVIIFARRGGPNQAVIDMYELPRSMFSVAKP